MPIVFKSLEKESFHSLFIAFNAAFKDYEMQVNEQELGVMLQRRGFNPKLSFGAFDGDKLVSFTFNGIGQFSGRKTAYDTGTGTIKEYRKQGLASKIFEYSIPFLKQAGIGQYLLEVLQHNSGAVSVYQKLGFQVSRAFNYFVCKNEDLKLNSIQLQSNYQIKQIEFSRLRFVSSFWDYYPSWQNSFDSIARQAGTFKVFGAFEADKLVGYCIFEANSGDITQLAVSEDHRRKGIGSALLKEAASVNHHSSIKLINSDISSKSTVGFLESNGISLSGKQFEMIRVL